MCCRSVYFLRADRSFHQEGCRRGDEAVPCRSLLRSYCVRVSACECACKCVSVCECVKV